MKKQELECEKYQGEVLPKFDFMLGIRYSGYFECCGFTSYMEQGKIDEILEVIERPDIAIRYTEVIFNGIQEHYYSAL